VIAGASGKWLTDVDGNRYLDYHGGLGSAVLGYADPRVDGAVIDAMGTLGTFVGAPHVREGEFAERLCGTIPGAERVAFCGGGASDAIYHAVRIARATTGRRKIVRVEGGYHGWQGDIAVSSRPTLTEGSRAEAPKPVPDSAGVLPEVSGDVIVVNANDRDELSAVFAEHQDEIAATIIEPVLFSVGCVLVEAEFIQLARSLCTRTGAVLILDEVLTGFRCGVRGLAPLLDVTPDLAVYGKAMANGYIMSALVGREALMEELTPTGPVYYAGTFNAHPLSLAAAEMTMTILELDDVPTRTAALGVRLGQSVNATIDSLGVNATCQQFGSIWSIYFNTRTVTRYRDLDPGVLANTDQLTNELRLWLLSQGIYVHNRYVLRCCISAQHDEEDVDRTATAIGDFLSRHQEELSLDGAVGAMETRL
jgi:glutamate-1-semialdehyde 2,1-aminomutase